jgi:iron-sulfur cluster repair protein YtfE (RIC family)
MVRGREQTVVDLLVGQHEDVRKQFEKVAKATGKNRAAAFDRLRYLLAVHETAEEEIVHPFARQAIGNGARIIGARLKEEKEAKTLLQQLERLDADSADFEPLLERLRKAVEAHAAKEEQVEFTKIAEKATPQQLKGMVAAVKIAEAIAPTHPHPGTESPSKNVTVGSVASVVDRTRDAIHKAMT